MIKGRVYASIAILTILFLVGSVLMGFEMLGSRYLNPYFGSGITTWACLISVVLLAMMAGYFTGGTLVDRWPRLELFSAACLLAGISLGIIPLTVDPVLEDILATVGDGFWGAILGAMWISFIPVALLSACSPFAVRLLLVDLKGGGMTAGLVYSVSTFGNVIGILATTFWLIPLFGVRTINFGFAVFMLLLGVTTLALCKKVPALLAARAVALVVLSGPAIGGLFVHGAGAQGAARMLPALYPEGPIWQEDRLFYTEMGKDTVSIAGPSSVYPFWREPGCGPTAISVFGSEDYIVLCHIGRKLVRLSKDGRKLGEYLTGADKKPFQDPNDVTSDGAGGVFFSDSGAFKSDAPSTGRVYHLAPDGKVTLLVERLHYANGIAFDAGARLLYVSEHLAH
ncbi:MAG: fused MFS/spermidine synthase [Hyphomicrobiaceae bacterium]